MTDVLAMTTRQFCYPIALVIEVKPNDRSLHVSSVSNIEVKLSELLASCTDACGNVCRFNRANRRLSIRHVWSRDVAGSESTHRAKALTLSFVSVVAQMGPRGLQHSIERRTGSPAAHFRSVVVVV